MAWNCFHVFSCWIISGKTLSTNKNACARMKLEKFLSVNISYHSLYAKPCWTRIKSNMLTSLINPIWWSQSDRVKRDISCSSLLLLLLLLLLSLSSSSSISSLSSSLSLLLLLFLLLLFYYLVLLVICLFVCLFICLFVYLFICLFIYLFIYLLIGWLVFCLFVCLFTPPAVKYTYCHAVVFEALTLNNSVSFIFGFL